MQFWHWRWSQALTTTSAFVPYIRGVVATQMSNVHGRIIAAPAARVGALLDTLASADDKFWPHENWPRVKFNLPLQVGATGGHGTGPYTVSSYTPGRHIRFKFGGGRQGYHEFTLQEVDDMTCLLRQSTKAQKDVATIRRTSALRGCGSVCSRCRR
jgi:hypothetical protein